MSSGTGPTFVNYSSLVQDIQRYLERGQSSIGDPTVFDQIPRLINAAERKIIQALKLQGMQETLIDNTGLVAGKAVMSAKSSYNNSLSFGVAGLPAGLYGINYFSQYTAQTSWANQRVFDGQVLSTTAPIIGAISIHGL